MTDNNNRIPESVLTETWYALMHDLLAEMQRAYHRQRRERGFDQKEIAARIGRDPASVSRCLSGQQNMTVRTMHNIARGMNCRLKVTMEDLDEVAKANTPRPIHSWAKLEPLGTASSRPLVEAAE